MAAVPENKEPAPPNGGAGCQSGVGELVGTPAVQQVGFWYRRFRLPFQKGMYSHDEV